MSEAEVKVEAKTKKRKGENSISTNIVVSEDTTKTKKQKEDTIIEKINVLKGELELEAQKGHYSYDIPIHKRKLTLDDLKNAFGDEMVLIDKKDHTRNIHFDWSNATKGFGKSLKDMADNMIDYIPADDRDRYLVIILMQIIKIVYHSPKDTIISKTYLCTLLKDDLNKILTSYIKNQLDDDLEDIIADLPEKLVTDDYQSLIADELHDRLKDYLDEELMPILAADEYI
jgi:hypothetical protein